MNKKTANKKTAVPTLITPMMVVGPMERFTGWTTLRGATSCRLVAEHKCPYCEKKLARNTKSTHVFPGLSAYEGHCTNKKCRAEVALIPAMRRPRGIVRNQIVVLLNG